MSLLERLSKVGSIKSSSILSESAFFIARDKVETSLPILNIAFSGDIHGGLVPGLTILSGASKSFKTLLALYCLKAYFEKYPDAICLFYDSEFGTPPAYLKTYNIDTDRIIHIPVEHVEQLKFDIVKRLDEIKRDDHVFLFLDSLGSLPSKKEVEDATDEKSVSDMTRAKAIRSLLRIVTPHLTTKDIPFIIINHVYSTMELYSKTVIPGGTAVTYCANQVFVITKAQEKDKNNEITGYHFTINIEKSRYVKEKSRLSFYVDFEKGISKWSGLMELGLESGHVIKPSQGWYQRVDMETGEVLDGKLRLSDTNSKDFWKPILADEKFNEYVRSKFCFGEHQLTDNFDDDEVVELGE